MNLTGLKPRQKEAKPWRSKDYLKWIAALPCVACKANHGSDAAHIRIDWYRKGQKPPDNRVTPLCRECHTKQHSMNERDFWEQTGIDPFVVAGRLYTIWETGRDWPRAWIAVMNPEGKRHD